MKSTCKKEAKYPLHHLEILMMPMLLPNAHLKTLMMLMPLPNAHLKTLIMLMPLLNKREHVPML
jgi:hypothetical protein